MKKTLISTLILVFAFTALLAQAKRDQKEHKFDGKDRDCAKGQMMQCDKGEKQMMDIWQKLKLNPEQQQTIRALHETHKKLMNTVRAEIKNHKIDLMNAIKAENFANARAIQKQISDKRLTLADARLTKMESVLKELTAEQKEVFRKLLPKLGHGGEILGCQFRKGGDEQCKGMRDSAKDCTCNCGDCR